MLSGESTKRQRSVKRVNGHIIISESYTPIFDDMDQIYKVLNIGVDVNIEGVS